MIKNGGDPLIKNEKSRTKTPELRRDAAIELRRVWETNYIHKNKRQNPGHPNMGKNIDLCNYCPSAEPEKNDEQAENGLTKNCRAHFNQCTVQEYFI